MAHGTLSASDALANGAIREAHGNLRRALIGLHVPSLSTWPLPEDWDELREYLLNVCRSLDAWMYEVGREASSNSIPPIDMSVFEGVFTSAIDMALREMKSAAEAAREDREAAR